MKTLYTLSHVLVFILISLFTYAQEIPTGNSCSEAIPLQCGSIESGNTIDVLNDNVSSGAGQCITSVGTGGQKWYSFSDTESHQLTAFTCGAGTTFDTKIHVYSGACGSLACIAGNDDGCSSLASTLNFTSQPGVNYLIRVGGFGGVNGAFVLNLTCASFVSGCTNPTASNYNPLATQDDGSCIYTGCTDPTALNYNASANTDDGSCEYCNGEGSTIATLYVCTFSNGAQTVLDIVDSNGNVVQHVSGLGNGQIVYFSLCLQAGMCYTAIMANAVGATGWSNGYFWINVNGVQIMNESLNSNLTTELSIFSIDGTCTSITGCTNPEAANYNAYANLDDGSCVFPVDCESAVTAVVNMTTAAFASECSFTIVDESGQVLFAGANYQVSGSIVESICLNDGCYTVLMNDSFGDGWNGGYLQITALGITTTYTISSGNVGVGILSINSEGCTANVISGCMNPAASNYNPAAIFDDGSCVITGCTDSGATNYNPAATSDDGSCTYCNGVGSVNAQLYLCTFANGNQVQLEILDADGNVVYFGNNYNNNSIVNTMLCLQAGVCYTAIMTNSAGLNGWYNGYFWINAGGIQIINSHLDAAMQTQTIQFSLNGNCGDVSGCTDPAALNYNASATIDDGSCSYAEPCESNAVVITIVTESWGSEISWNLTNAAGEVVASGGGYSSWNTYTTTLCLPDGCYELQMNDSWGDGWNGGYYMISSANSFNEGSLFYGSTTTDLIGINVDCNSVAGCMDNAAVNYNPAANYDDGSCIYNSFNPGMNTNYSVGLELEFTFFPNPTNEGITVNLNNLDTKSGINVLISGLDGKLISSIFEANAEKFRRFQLDLSDLSAGYYFVKVVNGTNVQTMPLIKQ